MDETKKIFLKKKLNGTLVKVRDVVFNFAEKYWTFYVSQYPLAREVYADYKKEQEELKLKKDLEK